MPLQLYFYAAEYGPIDNFARPKIRVILDTLKVLETLLNIALNHYAMVP